MIMDKQQDPKITRAKKTSSRYKANTVNILNRNPNEAKSIEMIMDKQQDPKITLARKTSSK